MSDRHPGTAWWEAVAAHLQALEIHVVFALPGDDMLGFGVFRRAGIDVVLARTQWMAVLMAAGSSIVEQRPAVVLIGRGPGAVAAVPAVLEAAGMGARVVVISGGAPLGAARPTTFQFAPQLELMRLVCRVASRPETGDDLAFRIAQAFTVADGAAGGVVYVEMPDPGGVQLEAPSHRGVPGLLVRVEGRVAAPDIVRSARRPVLLVGGGCRRLPAGAIEAWARESGAAILVTASGRGTVSEEDSRYLGLSGLYTTSAASALLARADLVVALGTRLEETATVGWPNTSPCVQVALDPGTVDPLRPGAFVQADVADVTGWGDAMCAEPSWGTEILTAREAGREWAARCTTDNVVASAVSLAVSLLPPGSVVCHENGLMDIWSYLHPVTIVPAGVAVVVPSELTTMGAGCAAALGAREAAARRGGIVLVITGDGAAGIVADELRHVSRRGSGVVMLVLDNGGYGWLEHQDRSVNGVTGAFVDRVAEDLTRGSEATHGKIRRSIADVRPGEVRRVRVPCRVEDAPPLDYESA